MNEQVLCLLFSFLSCHGGAKGIPGFVPHAMDGLDLIPAENLKLQIGKGKPVFVLNFDCSHGYRNNFFVVFVLELRNARQSLEGLRSTDDWWDWCLTTLLDGLHLGGPSAAAAAAAAQGTQVGFPFPLHCTSPQKSLDSQGTCSTVWVLNNHMAVRSVTLLCGCLGQQSTPLLSLSVAHLLLPCHPPGLCRMLHVLRLPS